MSAHFYYLLVFVDSQKVDIGNTVTIVNSGNYNIALVIHLPFEATLLNGSVEIFSRINECILQSNNIILFFLVTYRVQLHVLTMVMSIQRK